MVCGEQVSLLTSLTLSSISVTFVTCSAGQELAVDESQHFSGVDNLYLLLAVRTQKSARSGVYRMDSKKRKSEQQSLCGTERGYCSVDNAS